MPNGVYYELMTSDNQIIRAHYNQIRKVRMAPNYIKTLYIVIIMISKLINHPFPLYMIKLLHENSKKQNLD